MYGRELKVIASAALLSIAAVGGEAKASVIDIEPGGTYTIAPGNDYHDVETLERGSNSYTYFFNVSGPAVLTVTSVVDNQTSSFTVSWLDGDDNPLVSQQVNQGNPLNFSETFVADHIYQLDISRPANSNATTSFTLDIITTTPLPPALLLFATAFAGLTWLSRRGIVEAV